ncbi:MAG TPA: Imm40 family immunity protein [Ktedonobacterales bacterium]
MPIDVPPGIPPQLLDAGCETISGELAWQYPAILEVVAAAAVRGYTALGGEVFHDEGGRLDYMRGDMYCGNWHLDMKPDEQSWAEYLAESVAVTKRYIEAFVRRNDASLWYAPTFATDIRE